MPNGNDYKWGGYRHPMNRNIGGRKFEQATSVGDGKHVARQESIQPKNPVPVQLPPHLFVPADAQVIDMRRAADIAAGTTDPFLLMSFTCPKGAVAHFTQYAVFSDGALAANQEFIPRSAGARAFPYQGDPNDNFRINLGLAPDLSNNSLIQCQLTINPGEKVEWFVKNTNAVDIAMGVRMVGYIDRDQKRINARSGG